MFVTRLKGAGAAKSGFSAQGAPLLVVSEVVIKIRTQ